MMQLEIKVNGPPHTLTPPPHSGTAELHLGSEVWRFGDAFVSCHSEWVFYCEEMCGLSYKKGLVFAWLGVNYQPCCLLNCFLSFSHRMHPFTQSFFLFHYDV